MLCQIHEIASRAKNGSGALSDLDPDFSEARRAWAPLAQFHPEKFLEFADLHRQGWLTDGAFLCGASEVLAPDEGVKISKLPYRQHERSLMLVLFQSDTS